MRIIDWSSDVCYSYLLVMGDDGHRGRRAVQRIADAAADAGHAVIRGHPHFGRGLARAEIAQLALNLLAGRLVGFRGDRGFEPRDRLAEQAIPARGDEVRAHRNRQRSEEHTSELQSLMRISYAVFCLKKKTKTNEIRITNNHNN